MDGNDIDALVGETIEAYRPGLERYVRKLVRDPDEAADVVQETCVRLLMAARSEGMPRWPGGWMARVAHNLVVSRARHQQVVAREAERLVSRNVVGSTEEAILRGERNAEIRSWLDAARRDDRTAIVLAASGFRTQEIAERLGRTEPATRTLLSRARSRIRQSFDLTELAELA